MVITHSVTNHLSQNFAWSESGPVLLSQTEACTDGHQSWQTTLPNPGQPVTSYSHSVSISVTNRYQTNIAPDGSISLSTFRNGRLLSSQRYSGSTNVSSVSYGYDAHGRQNTITDARNGTTTYTFNGADLVYSVTTPAPGTLGGTGKHPFTPQWLTPSIDYNVTWTLRAAGANRVQVSIQGTRDKFPAYEAVVDWNVSAYSYTPTDPGPTWSNLNEPTPLTSVAWYSSSPLAL